jgi:hypothetical protein
VNQAFQRIRAVVRLGGWYQVGPLLDQVAGAVASFIADGAYDQGST